MLLNLYFHHNCFSLPLPGGGPRFPIPFKPLRRRPREEDEAFLLAVLH
jgi:hypothetical protein